MTKELKLFCIIDKGSTSFSVTVSTEDSVDDLKKKIKSEKPITFTGVDADELALWRAVIPGKSDDEAVFLENIEKKKKLNERALIGNLNKFKGWPRLTAKEAYIIIEPPNREDSRVRLGIKDVIEEIQKGFHDRARPSNTAPQLSSMMPLQERPMDNAIDIVVENVGACLSWQNDREVAKSESSFLVSSGTAGIGKTRYGQELYNSLKLHLTEKAKAKDINYSPHYYYMLLDFSKNVKLSLADASLDTETILGLRLAYAHFFRGKYDEGFPDFCHQALNYDGLFTITNAIIAIREDLNLSREQPFFLFLHIDQFQRIFSYRWEGTTKGRLRSLPEAGAPLVGDKTEHDTTGDLSLFQDMMRTLGSLMSGGIKPHMIQTFLSGTARQDVTHAAEPNSYSFKFLSCPTLSMGARYDVMGHFAGLAQVSRSQWMSMTAFRRLLSATGGLPRALQLLLEELFGRRLEKLATFSEKLHDIDMNTDLILDKVAAKLDTYYSITSFAETHEELVRALVRLYTFQKPSSRNLAPCDEFPTLTLDVLERDKHTILEDSEEIPGKVLVQIPPFFLYLYNTVITAIPTD